MFTSNSTEQCSGREVISNTTVGSIQDHQGALGASNYTDNAHCLWELVAPSPSQSMEIQFSLFNVALNDLVTIYDGNETTSPIIKRFTGSAVPAIISPSSQTVLVEFQTDNDTSSTGIYFKFQGTVNYLLSRTEVLTVCCSCGLR